MPTIQQRDKEHLIDVALARLTKVYQPDSGLFQQVRAALVKKLSKVEASQLALLITTTVDEPKGK